MASRDLNYKFEDVELQGLKINGLAVVEYGQTGQWRIHMVCISSVFNSSGDEVMRPVWRSVSLRDQVTTQCAAAIQSAVDEAIYRRDD